MQGEFAPTAIADCHNAAVTGTARSTELRSDADADLATGEIRVSGVVNVADAVDAIPGEDYGLVYEASQTGVEDYIAFDPASVAADCEMISKRVRLGEDPMKEFAETVGTFDERGFHEIADTATDGAPWQMFSSTWQSDDVRWIETSSTNLDWSDWRVMADGEELANSEAFFNTEEPPPVVEEDSRLSASTGQLAWNTARPGTGEPVVLVLDGSGVRELASDVWVHAASDDAVYYVRGAAARRASILRVPDGSVQEESVLDLKVPKGRQISRLAVHGDTLAFLVSSLQRANGESAHNGQVYVVNLSTMETVVVQTAGDGQGYLDTNGEVVVFGEGSGMGDPGQYMFMVKSSALVRLGEAEGLSGVGVAGDVVAWDFIDEDDNVGIRVARLP